MIKKINKVGKHTGGLFGITSNPDFPWKINVSK